MSIVGLVGSLVVSCHQERGYKMHQYYLTFTHVVGDIIPVEVDGEYYVWANSIKEAVEKAHTYFRIVGKVHVQLVDDMRNDK